MSVYSDSIVSVTGLAIVGGLVCLNLQGMRTSKPESTSRYERAALSILEPRKTESFVEVLESWTTSQPRGRILLINGHTFSHFASDDSSSLNHLKEACNACDDSSKELNTS